MNKRGQVTVFVIVGIVIVITIALIFYFLGDNIKRQTDTEVVLEESSLDPMIKLVEDCVGDEVLKGVELIGLQGGYFNPPKYSQEGDYQVSYNCHKDGAGVYINRLPTLNMIAQEVEEYISASDSMELIEECIDGFKVYKNQGYKIDDGNIGVGISIGRNIIVYVAYPVEISRGDFVSSFNGVKFQIDSGLMNAYLVAVDIINDECTGTIFDIDDYVSNGLPLAFIDRQLVNDIKLFYYLTTIPRGDVDTYKFHFIVER